jgi:hypothetical protein
MARVEVRPGAGALLAAYGPLAALVVLPDDDGAACCRVGFDVLALPAGEGVPPELVLLGMADEVPVYAAWAIEPGRVGQLVLACEDGADALTAVLL